MSNEIKWRPPIINLTKIGQELWKIKIHIFKARKRNITDKADFHETRACSINFYKELLHRIS